MSLINQELNLKKAYLLWMNVATQKKNKKKKTKKKATKNKKNKEKKNKKKKKTKTT